MAKYNIYEKDGAVFRGKAGAGFVRDVWTSEGWVPYDGDRLAPVTFGDHLRQENDREVPAGGTELGAVKAAAPVQCGRSGRNVKDDGN